MGTVVFLGVLCAGLFALPALRATEPAGLVWDDEEERLLDVLSAGGAVAGREAACVRLQRIGSERAIPALAALLTDPRLAHAARAALESMPSPAAGRALAAALRTTTGDARLGVLASLGVRRDREAAPRLAELWAELKPSLERGKSDPPPETVALAAALWQTLGELDHPAVVPLLEEAWGTVPEHLRTELAPALLQQAQLQGQAGEARRLFAAVRDGVSGRALRAAAIEGWLRSSPPAEALAFWEAAMTGPAGAELDAALRVTAELAAPGAGRALARRLPELVPERQVAVLEAWRRRADWPDRKVVLGLRGSPDGEVRRAAVVALGRVGDAGDVDRLLAIAAASGPEQQAAREALVNLRARRVTSRLLDALEAPAAAVRAEAARALGERGERSAGRRLLALAGAAEPEVRVAALRALALVAELRQCDDLLRLVQQAPDETRRSEAVRALILVGERLQPAADDPALRRWRQAVTAGSPTMRAALLAVAGVLPGEATVAILRAALEDAEPIVRRAAARAATRSQTEALFPVVVKAAGEDPDEEVRELATRAAVRLASREGTRIKDHDRREMLRVLGRGAASVAQKRTLLTVLAGGRGAEELELALGWLEEAELQREAAAVVVKVAPRVAEPERARQALATVAMVGGDEEWRRELAAATKAVADRAEHVTAWLVTGSLRVTGRGPAELLEAKFGPETLPRELRSMAGRARLAGWEPMRVGLDARNPMLLRAESPPVPGVAYACTWVRVPEAQPAQLEVSHEHGVKVWLNEREVFRAGSAARLPPRSPARAEVELQAGWNLLLIKLAQPGKPAAFAVRIADRRGAPIPGLTVNPDANLD